MLITMLDLKVSFVVMNFGQKSPTIFIFSIQVYVLCKRSVFDMLKI